MTDSSYLEVSLTVDGELAESVAEVLNRFMPNGVVIESTEVYSDPDGIESHATGPLRVFGFLPIDEQVSQTQRRLEEALWYLGRIQPLPEIQFRNIQQTNWAEAWKQHYRPIAIGRRLMVVPAWMESSSVEKISIRINPGMAFGTGTHPSTQLCLELIESFADRFLKNTKMLDVIDLGCGTAILSIAALKLGATRALGVDVDPEAINAAQDNAKRNEVTDKLALEIGSLADILSGAFSLQKSHLVVANILAPVLVRMLNEGLSELLAPQGCLILSGILSEQAEQVESSAHQNNLYLLERRQIGDWVALCYKFLENPDGETSTIG
jgi:ribosomal protein L11 methyltransferase